MNMYKDILRRLSKTKQAAIIAVVAFIAILIISTFVLFKFVSIESDRDLANWETRLGILADSRANAVNEWVTRQFSELTSLAENQSLQLYVSQLMQPASDTKEDPFQVSYLRNLLVFTAERGGFAGQATTAINANVPTESTSGIAILDKDKKVLVSTIAMPPLEGRLAEILVNLPQAENYISNIYKGVNGKPSVIFSVPIPSVQSDGSGKNYVGTIIGIQTVEDSLFPLLKQPGATEKTAEALLVKIEGNILNYLSPTNDGSAALTKNINVTPELEANFAVVNPGLFSIKRDYVFNKVLVTGRKIANTPWTLVYKIDRDEALEDSDTHIRNLLTIGIITIFFITAAIVAMWQYANFLKESKIAERYRKMMMDLKAQKHILRVITDNKPEVTFIVDGKNRYRFANLKAAQQAGISARDMIGQSMVNIMGKDNALPYVKMNAIALADHKTVTTTQRFHIDGEEKIIQSCHIPLMHIPSPDDGKFRDGVLVIEQDITVPIQSKEKLLRALNAIIDTLLSFVDKRDKYTADHSARVARLAFAIAAEMGLDDVLQETVKTAGKLMNLGRMLIPLNLLTKAGELTHAEQHIFDDTTNVSAELLEEIEFEGPVIETIKQSQEHVDGTGPYHLHDEDILITARILAVANVFVAMRSPRAHRLMKTLDETILAINEESGTKFDRKVVAALVNYIENRGGRENWKHPEEITGARAS